MQGKKKQILEAIEKNECPPPCKNRWSRKDYPDRKCQQNYCKVNNSCDYFANKYGKDIILPEDIHEMNTEGI
jgi:hypothetical protein